MTPGRQSPVITVASVVGSQRQRVRRLLADLAAQTIEDQIEVLLVDTRPELGGIDPPPGLRMRVLGGESLSFGQARAKAARDAGAEIIAFLEDHCYPDPGWAEALRAAYDGPWGSVGYAVGCANPGRLSSRINYLAHYGQWASPKPGPMSALPGNNVSYRRQALLDLGPELDSILGADFNVHAQLRRRGVALASEPQARVRHENEESISDACRSQFAYCRVLATERARLRGWRLPRRLAHAASILVAAPLLRYTGLLSASVRDPGRLARAIVFMPGIFTSYLAGALGESTGYLFGSGSAVERLRYWEVDAPRAGES